MEQQAGDHVGTLRNKLENQGESSQTTLQSICTQDRTEREQEARRIQVGTLQAIAHKIELGEETEARRVQAGTLQTIAHKVGLNEEKEAWRTSRHIPGGSGNRIEQRRKHQEKTWRIPLTP